jgi:hypothetical protein
MAWHGPGRVIFAKLREHLRGGVAADHGAVVPPPRLEPAVPPVNQVGVTVMVNQVGERHVAPAGHDQAPMVITGSMLMCSRLSAGGQAPGHGVRAPSGAAYVDPPSISP